MSRVDFAQEPFVFRQIILPDLAVLRVAAYEEGTCTQKP